jgi:hypothetical protein
MRSLVVQKEILSKLKIKIHAEPYWKKSMAERTIAENQNCVLQSDGIFYGIPPPPSPLCLANLKILYSF